MVRACSTWLYISETTSRVRKVGKSQIFGKVAAKPREVRNVPSEKQGYFWPNPSSCLLADNSTLWELMIGL